MKQYIIKHFTSIRVFILLSSSVILTIIGLVVSITKDEFIGALLLIIAFCIIGLVLSSK